MKTNELRIGNLVKLTYDEYHDLEEDGILNDKNNVFTIRKIDNDGDIEIYNVIENLYEFQHNENIEPIPLTEEWLIKFGFNKLNHLGMFVYVLYIDEWLNFEVDLKHSTFHLVSGQENNDLNIDIGSYTVYRLIEIEFIHEIQNLYYSFTKKELSLS